jgi:hemoglobin
LVTAAAETTPAAPYHRMGGHETFHAISNRFYDLMDSDPAYAQLRAMHAADLGPMRESLPLFLAGWAGGPRDWFDANPDRCMMSVHKPYVISKAVAGQWAEAMRRAVADVAPEPADMAKAMAEVLANLATGMGHD